MIKTTPKERAKEFIKDLKAIGITNTKEEERILKHRIEEIYAKEEQEKEKYQCSKCGKKFKYKQSAKLCQENNCFGE